jgi:hypothetical protein
MSKRHIVFLFFGFSTISSLLFQNCDGMIAMNGIIGSKGTSTGNPSLHLSFRPYGVMASGTQIMGGRRTVVAVDSLQNVSVVLCLSGLRFKTSIEASDFDTSSVVQVDFAPRQVGLSPLGTDLDFVTVPQSTYHQVVFELDATKCEGRVSVAVSNSYGQFAANEPISMRFTGEKHVDFTLDQIELGIQKVVEALATVTDSQQIKSKVEGAVGEL